MVIDIKGVTVLIRVGHTDHVTVETYFTAGVWPYDETRMDMYFEVVHRGGVEYVKKHFGLAAKVIDTTATPVEA